MTSAAWIPSPVAPRRARAPGPGDVVRAPGGGLRPVGVLAPAAVVALVLLLGACSASPVASTSDRLTVVATSTVFADLVANVGGDLVEVTSLVPKNADVHTFEARPSDVRAVAGARLLVMNGLGLDDWLRKAMTNAAASGTPVVTLGDAVPVDKRISSPGGGAVNPHAWLDVALAGLYVDRIAQELSRIDPTHASAYAARAATYRARLTELDGGVRSSLASIPTADRRIVTFHDAFPYFARAYGLEVVGVAVRAPGQDPSAAETAQLIDSMKAGGVKAILAERQFPSRLADRLAAETGTKVVSNLYSDSLGDPPVTSYLDLVRWDADRISEALR